MNILITILIIFGAFGIFGTIYSMIYPRGRIPSADKINNLGKNNKQ